jgi:hypothetical protein
MRIVNTQTIADVRTNTEHRDMMLALEASIENELDPLEPTFKHYYAHGTYTRELFLPKGSVVVGKIHRHTCTNILLQGKVLAVTDELSQELTAPLVFVSGPGVKKAVYALEDSIWLNVHPWDGEADLEQIENDVIIPSYEALEQEQNQMIEEQ